MLDSRCPRAGVHDASEYGYDQWLCELFLFELRMSLSGVVLRVEVVLRSASACRVEWLCRPRVTLARLVGPCGLW